MVRKILQPARIPDGAGKLILEYAGRASGGLASVSVAHMVTPGGWSEPFQQPMFDEVTVVTRGTIRVEHQAGSCDVMAGEAVIVPRGERIRYSNPGSGKAEYWAICTPAFEAETAGREA